ncbi:mechanosensitive ion channel family protein [Isoalcanivorax indicus]|uniref:mechanosensitive ion channel family protein n=1 Tax=Isoalcanivorax indicus TaxID=2202653 RepID=UPI000DB96F49|nr:mechanosensitive ion channel domain-containing protein [Isoalcanivorax indicus]
MEEVTALSAEFVEQNLVPYTFNIIAALAIFIIGRWLVKRIAALMETGLKRKVDPTVATFLARVAHVALLAFVIIAAVDRLGVQTASLIALFGAAGLAVGLALNNSLANFAAGVMLLVLRPFKVGDYVEAGNTAGTIREIRIFSTLMTSPDNKVILVPNGSIMNNQIVNYSAMPTRRVDLVFGVSYDADLSKVKEAIKAVLAADERILADPAPNIAVSELADSSVNLIVRPWVNSADYWAVYWGTIEAVKRKFDDEGITIPFPQMDVHFDKPE